MLKQYKKIPVRTVYMEMVLRPEIKVEFPENVYIRKIENINIDVYKSIYKQVGEKWGWTGRLIISDKELQKKLDDSNDEIYILFFENEIAGFFELLRHDAKNVELVYMGLIPNCIGKGLGKILLNYSIQMAWAEQTERFWLHTCEFDHKDAFKIYEKAGFKKVSERIEYEYYPLNFNVE